MTRTGIALVLLLLSCKVAAAAGDGNARVFPFYPSNTPAFQSFLRIINPINSPATVTLVFQDYDTESQRGATCTLQIPGYAAPQYTAQQLEQCAGKISPPATASILSWPISSTNTNLYFQQVLWSPNTGYFTSGSSCSTQGAPNDFVPNVHTSAIAGYPANIVLLINAPLNYQLNISIYDAGTGNVIGTWTSPAQSYQKRVMNMNMSLIEQQAAWTVSTKPAHVNLKISVVPAGGGDPFAPVPVQVAGNWVTQTARTEIYNLFTMCKN